jgi:DNA ligase (NAD+)
MAVFDKTKLNNGVEYTKVSLSSYKNLKEKDFRVGEMVILQYRHDTLGYIEKDPSFNNEHLPKTKFIKNCLYCGEPIKLNDSKNLAFCVNKDCDGLKIGKIVAFINNIKLKGIEFQKVESLFKYGYIKSIKSLFTIKESKKLEITKEKGWGNKSVENFFEIINSRNNDMTDYELLGSMSIETIGREMALEFCKKFHLFEFLTSFNYENKEKYITQITETNKVKGFSNIRAEHIIDGINENLNLIIYLLTRVYRNCKYSYDEYKNKKQSDKIYNLVITGDIPGLNREEVIRKLKDLGHTVTNKISGKTNYLVCNDKASGTTKVQDAIKFGVEIITSDKLFSLLEIKEENEYEKSKNRAVGVKF